MARIVYRRLWLLVLFTGVILTFKYEAAWAVDTPSFLNAAQSAEQSLGGPFREVFDYVLFAAMGLGAIGAGVGVAQLNGWIGKRDSGAEMIKWGIASVVIAGVFKGIVSFFAGVAA